MHDKMFASFRQISRATILRWAQEAGIEMKAFQADLDSGKYKATVAAEQAEGMKAGGMGTPTFFIHQRQALQRTV
ncbi:MAG: DsbA family protein [Bryobacteraceae bacterium]|nr:DsbA family protein [Bryobacteraceae bacterium]